MYCVAFSPNGELLAAAGRGRYVRVYNVASGKEVHSWKSHTDDVRSVHFAPSGTLLASGGDDTTARLWDVMGGASGVVLRGHTKTVNSVCFSPLNADLLATASNDDTARLWEVSSGTELHKFKCSGSVCSVDFSPLGLFLAAHCEKEVVLLWDVATLSKVPTGAVKGAGWKGVLHFAPTGTLLATPRGTHGARTNGGRARRGARGGFGGAGRERMLCRLRCPRRRLAVAGAAARRGDRDA